MNPATLPRTRAEANAQRSKYFYAGASCPHGHVAPRRAHNGGCTACAADYQRRRYGSKRPKRTPLPSEPKPGQYYPDTRAWARVLGRLRSRSRKRGTECTLVAADLAAIWNGRCALSGAMLRRDLGRPGPGPSPFSATVDRIDPSRGYVPGNVRFLAHCVNCFKQTMTDDQLITTARLLVSKHEAQFGPEDPDAWMK